MITTRDTGSRMLKGEDAARELRGTHKHDPKLENSTAGVTLFVCCVPGPGLLKCWFVPSAAFNHPSSPMISYLFVLPARATVLPHAAASRSYQKSFVRTSLQRTRVQALSSGIILHDL